MAEEDARLEAAICAMIVFRIARSPGPRKEPLVKIARTSGIPLGQLWKIARRNGIKYPHRHPTPDQIKTAIALVEVEGLTFSQAAETVGLSKSAVHRYVQRKRARIIDSAGSMKIEVKQWRCPKHGSIRVSPCVACEAEKARDANQ